MKALLDEQLSPRIGELLRNHGHDAQAVDSRIDLTGRADRLIPDVADAEDRAVITRNMKPISLADVVATRDLILSELDHHFFKDRFASATDSVQDEMTGSPRAAERVGSGKILEISARTKTSSTRISRR